MTYSDHCTEPLIIGFASTPVGSVASVGITAACWLPAANAERCRAAALAFPRLYFFVFFPLLA